MTPDRAGALRSRQDETGESALRRRNTGLVPAFPALVGRVFGDPTVPGTSGVFVSVHPVDVGGPEGESAPGVLSVDTSRSFRVYVVGSLPPAAGDDLICRFVGNRWVAERMGVHRSAIVLPGCPCKSLPATLHMSSSRPDSNNRIFQPAVLTYGPTPPVLMPLGIAPQSYLSTATFTDAVTGDQFWYHLTCSIGYYVLTRVYARSVYGSPFRDTIRYRWLVGLPGNTCKPLLFSNGEIFPGGDASCVVTISE